jgi:hypothetical protein
MRGAVLLIGAVMAGLLLAACGESDEDKAKSQVCDARADRKKQVEAANTTFRSEVGTITQEIVSGVAGGDVKPRLESAVSDLAASYNETFAPVSCD